MQASSLRLIVIVGATLLALTGCGGGDGDSTANANPPNGSQNAAPTIQGQPIGSVVPGRAYSFQPTASDADGDTLTFTVANLPAWATFDSSTGRISGTPSDADVATYNDHIVKSDTRIANTIGNWRFRSCSTKPGMVFIERATTPNRDATGNISITRNSAVPGHCCTN